MASGGRATQLSPSFNWRARDAIYGHSGVDDGNSGADYLYNHCSHTFYPNNPCWKLTFKRPVLAKEITIHNTQRSQ